MASIRDRMICCDIHKIAELTTEEVLGAARKITENETPGLDGIPNKALFVTTKKVPGRLSQIFKSCFNEGGLPEKWKQQLIPKPNKLSGDPSSYIKRHRTGHL